MTERIYQIVFEHEGRLYQIEGTNQQLSVDLYVILPGNRVFATSNKESLPPIVEIGRELTAAEVQQLNDTVDPQFVVLNAQPA